MADNKILVAVRMKKIVSLDEKPIMIHWHVGNNNDLVQKCPITGKIVSQRYCFDHVFDTECKNSEIFDDIAQPIVQGALQGINGTIFVYGATSSGKTYTMMGDENNAGIIPHAIHNIFESIQRSSDREFMLRASYIEIYNEEVFDLIADREKQGKSLAVRETSIGSVDIVNLTEISVDCKDELMNVLKKGNKNRHISETNMNERSSRSHTIFRVMMESFQKNDSNKIVNVSQLNLVDLAGIENVSQTGATGERLKEGCAINKSLLELSNVIYQLSKGQRFVNRRNSQLTWILRQALGGNAKTAIICNIAPTIIDQTVSTIRFAVRAKTVRNRPKVNELPSDKCSVKHYMIKINDLKSILEDEKNRTRDLELKLSEKSKQVEQMELEICQLKKKNQEIEARYESVKNNVLPGKDENLHCRRASLDAEKSVMAGPARREGESSKGDKLEDLEAKFIAMESELKLAREQRKKDKDVIRNLKIERNHYKKEESKKSKSIIALKKKFQNMKLDGTDDDGSDEPDSSSNDSSGENIDSVLGFDDSIYCVTCITGCRMKYCICHKSQRMCSDKCGCVGCQNK